MSLDDDTDQHFVNQKFLVSSSWFPIELNFEKDKPFQTA